MYTLTLVILLKKTPNIKTTSKAKKPQKRKTPTTQKPSNRTQGLFHTLSLPLSEDPPRGKETQKPYTHPTTIPSQKISKK